MANISISIARGKDGFRIDDFTVGTTGPSSNDIMLAFSTTDSNSALLTVKDVVLALRAFERALESRSLQLPSGTPWIGQPIL
jgi:hypothetical protein